MRNDFRLAPPLRQPIIPVMRGRLALLNILIGFAAIPAFAQAPVPAKPASPDSTAKSDEKVIAFRNAAQDRMTVPVTIGNAGPFEFVVDTGAERSVISSELALTLRLGAGPRARLFDFAGASIVDTVSVPSLSVSALGTTTTQAPVLSSVNLGASGMLGIDALQGQKVVIDFNRMRMTLVPAKRHASGEVVVRAQGRVGQLIITDATFYGQPIEVIIDTGSWVSVGNRAMLALAKHPPRQIRHIVVTSVTGRSFEADLVTVNALKIGGVGFDRFGLAFADAPPFERFGLHDRPALILGMSSLKLFRRVEVDFANREIAFTLPRPRIDFMSLCANTMSPCNSY